MSQIDLRRFDLNLLVVFDILMIERSVTRAAERLGRTQSAVSHSLSRLREQFGDPLLIKGGVRMQPTAFAIDLIEQARPMLGGIQRVLTPQHVFDPANSRRVFRLAAPDFMRTLFADLLLRLHSEAPLAAIEWTAPREPTLLDVAEGLIDVAIVPTELRWPHGVGGEAVGALGWRCFGRRAHPAFSKWGRQSWARLSASGGAGRGQRDKPGQCRGQSRGPRTKHRRLGAELLGRGADPGRLGPAFNLAIGGDGRNA